MRAITRAAAALLALPCLCGTAFVTGYVILVALTIPQLPAWAQPGVTEWLFDIPQDSEPFDSSMAAESAPSITGAVGWGDHSGPGGEVAGVPLWGPITHWSGTHPLPLLGCLFHDPAYPDHTGVDLPVAVGTPVHATMGGEVVWAADHGPWGLLVVIQNGDHQVWVAHLDSIMVVPGQIVAAGEVLGLSGNSGNSTGPHLHYAVKQRRADGTYAWLNPQLFFDPGQVIAIGCGE